MNANSPTPTPSSPVRRTGVGVAITIAGLIMAAAGQAGGIGVAGAGVAVTCVLTIMVSRDVRRGTDAAQALIDRQASVFQALTEGVIILDGDRNVEQINDAACTLVGLGRAECLGKPPGAGLVEFVDRMGRPHAPEALPSVLAGAGTEVSGVVMGADRRDGTRVWVRCSSRLADLGHGEPRTVLVVSDITAQINTDMATEAETAQLRHRALHDSLTGLPNRTMLMDRLSHAKLNAERRGAGTGLIVIDLDGFKGVNDTLGHAAGDEVLVQVAVRLRTALRAADTAARLGGDEFVVLCEDLNPAMADLELERIAERITKLVNQPYITTLGPADVGASLGWAVAGPEDDLTLELVTQADEAMLTDKRERKRERSSRMRSISGPLPEASEKNLTVFIIDDDPAMRLLASRIIEADPTSGLTVIGEAPDGGAAVGEVIARAPDLVLCDVMMPGLSGPQVVSAIREQNPAQRIIFWSATTAPELERYERDLGVPFVLKDRIEELPLALRDAAATATAGTSGALPQG